MKLITSPWSCQHCGGTFITDPPEHRLCDQCLANLTALARASFPGTDTCPACAGPICPDCGQAMTVLLTVTIPAPDPANGQTDLLITAYSTHHQEVTGDER
jgi:hypothetical protein